MKNFYNVNDVMILLDCSLSKAYRIMKKVNEEVKRSGGITQSGRVPVRIFDRMFFTSVDDLEKMQ